MNTLFHRLVPVFTVLFVSLFLNGCNTVMQEVLEKPEISVNEFKLVKAGLINQTFSIGLTISNPNKLPLPVKSLDYAIHIAGDEFASGGTDKPFSIPAKGSETITITVKLNLLRSSSHLMNILKSGIQAINYEVNGNIGIDLPFMGSIPIKKVGKLKLSR